MGGDADAGKVLCAIHKKVCDQQRGAGLKLLGAHRDEDPLSLSQ